MAEDDNFDIDIYGDDAPQEEVAAVQAEDDLGSFEHQTDSTTHDVKPETKPETSSSLPPPPIKPETSALQGTKRKAEIDERPIDPNSSHAVQIVELHWWITEDDVRGWCARSGSEAELKDLTFNEHKVNGKSKGQVYIEFSSQAAATAVKQYVDHTDTIKDPKRPVATYYHGPHNPYKTLPKDNARRNEARGNERNSNSTNSNFNNHNSNFGGNNNFRGRGNFANNRVGNATSGFNRGGFQGNMNPMANMANMAAMNTMPYNNMVSGFNNFNRGGTMMGGMRGGMQPNRGRGGMMGGMNPMMGQMGGMGMNGMPMGQMGMPNGMIGMGGGFPAQPFNAGFFQGQNAGAQAGGWENQHPAKRARPNE